MKCICGFKDEDVSNGWREEFKQVKGAFFIEEGDYYKHSLEIRLYACPACGTIRTDNWGES